VQKKTKRIQELLGEVQGILSTGAKTIRRIFYMIEGKISYDALGKHLVWARLHGVIGWNSIVESGRKLLGSKTWESFEDYIGDFGTDYSLDRTPSHKLHFEVWLEKDTLENMFYEITNKYSVGLLSTHGQISWTALKDASQRLSRGAVVLYFGDNDYYGNRMFRQNQIFLSQLGANPEFIKIALSDEQEKKWGLPNGAKLDGAPEDELKELLEVSIQEYIDLTVYEQILEQEKEDQTRLDAAYEKLREEEI